MRGAILRASNALIRRASRSSFHTTSTRAMPARTPWLSNRYPFARRSDHVDVYKSEAKGEVRVHDPYQWLEQNTDETEKWVDAEEAFTRQYLDQNTERQSLEDEIRKNTNYAKVLLCCGCLTNQNSEHYICLPVLVFCSKLEGRQQVVLVLQLWIAGSVWCVVACWRCQGI